MSRFIFVAFLIAVGIGTRTIWHPGENIEFVTTASLLSASYLGLGWALFVPMCIMVITDLILGNTNIFIFTWSGYLVIGILGYLSNLNKLGGKTKILRASGVGVTASLWFYLWTNFGVWLLDSWGVYPKTLSGLAEAYWYGLPFLKNNLLGNLIFVPLSFFVVEKAKKINLSFLKKLAI